MRGDSQKQAFESQCDHRWHLDEQLPEVAENADTKVFETRIRKCVSVRQAQSAHISLWDYDPECTAAEDFKAFIDEYLNQEEN